MLGHGWGKRKELLNLNPPATRRLDAAASTNPKKTVGNPKGPAGFGPVCTSLAPRTQQPCE